MYAREIGGREFNFGVSGMLSRNVLIMYDWQTNSLWSQLIGEAISGEMIGTRLDYLPSWMTTWSEWKAMHPETVALRKTFKGNRDPYITYYLGDSAGVLGRTLPSDERQSAPGLYDKEFVIGVELSGQAAAFPFGVLNDEPVVNHELAGEPILVVFDPIVTTHAVYSRVVAGTVLTFQADEADPGRVRDRETGTVWDRFSGTALSGTLAGERLARIKSTTSFWFGWEDFHPDTALYLGTP